MSKQYIIYNFRRISAAYAIPSLSVRPFLSVRPSVMFVYSVKTNKRIFKNFHRFQFFFNSSFTTPNIMAIFRRGLS